jgi:homoserine O-acetyltransferase
MDLHDLGRGRGGLATALARIEAPVLAVGVSSDVLYPAYQSREIVDAIHAAGGDARYVELDSPHGHDAFLIELDQVGEAITKFLAEVENDV